MTIALYRTYRPSTLAEVIGQDHVTEPLRRALEAGRVHHAYLFSGPRGCGKTSTARILARSLLCEQGSTAEPCGVCSFCVALAPNGSGLVDVIELDAASHGGVDDTRDLRERAAFMPAEARYKIYIIDEAHMVSKDGFNALLKLIEEPPDHVKFIFATTEVDKVLPTIRSRTYNYTFRLVPVRQLQANLAGICEAEKVPFEPAALTLIARASGGSVRDAQSIMGQLIAGSGPDGLTQTQVAAQLGVTDEALLDAVIEAVADHDGPALFGVVEQTVDSGHDVRRFVTDLLHRFRDLLVIHHAGDAATADVLDVSEDRREMLVGQAKRFGPTELTRFAEIVNTGLTQVKGSTSPRLQLEILAARLLVPTRETDPEATLARIDVLERRLAVIASAPHAGERAPAVIKPEQATTPVRENRPPPADPSPAVSRSGATGSRPPAPPPRPTLSALGEAQTAPVRRPAKAPPLDEPGAPTGEPSRLVAGSDEGEEAAPDRERSAGPAVEQQPVTDIRQEGGGPRDDRTPGSSRPAAHQPGVASRRGAPGGTAAVPSAPPRGNRSGTDPVGSRPAGDAPGHGDLDRINAIWSDLMAEVAQRSRVAAATWDGAKPASLSEGTLVVAVPSEGQAKSIKQSRRDTMLRTLLIESYGIDVQVVASAEPERAPSRDAPADDDPEFGTAGLSGVDLAVQALGATRIDEIER